MRKTFLWVLVAVAAFTAPLIAGESGSREYRATRTTTPPDIDGKPGEAAWASAAEISDFTQQDPNTGEAPTERTVVKVLYDDSAIYFAAWMYDSQRVTSRLARRDSYIAADWIAFYLDAHHDHRTALMFRVNPAGVVRDAFIEEENEDRDWNAVWDSAAAIMENGWTAEIRIPLSQLRFPSGASQVWGFNVHRETARNNEYSRLAHVPRNESGFVARFVHLVGLEGIQPKRSFEILPYVVARSELNGDVKPGDPYNSDSESSGDLGVDLKYALSSNLTLTGTINPDFGQVELDPAEINLTAFELFYPERRPFFLEGADLFDFDAGDPELFYSRRIGRAPQTSPAGSYDFIDIPTETTILGAVKLTGKTKGGWTIAALDAITSEERAFFTQGTTEDAAVVEPFTNYLVTRFAREIGANSRIGSVFTAVNRQADDDVAASLRESAYTAGTDGYIFFGNRDYQLDWSLFGTRVEGSKESIALTQTSPSRYFQRPDAEHVDFDPERTSLSGWGGRAAFEKRTGLWRFELTANALSPEAELNDVGFMTRSDQAGGSAYAAYVDPTPRKFLRHREVGISKANLWNLDNDILVDRYAASSFIVFSNYYNLFTFARYENETLDDKLTRGGPLAAKPAGWAVNLNMNTDYRSSVVFFGGLNLEGDDLGGDRTTIRTGVTWKPSSNVEVSFSPNHTTQLSTQQFVTRADDATKVETFGTRYVFADVDRTTVSLETRLDWSFAPNLSLQLYLQPFVASGDYGNFKELAAARSLDYFVYGQDVGTISFNDSTSVYTVDPDGAGSSQPFTFRDPDFNFRSLRGNAVVRWEFRPGSTMYFAWSENRVGFEPVGDFDFGRDFGELSEAQSDDVFLVKLSYWFGV